MAGDGEDISVIAGQVCGVRVQLKIADAAPCVLSRGWRLAGDARCMSLPRRPFTGLIGSCSSAPCRCWMLSLGMEAMVMDPGTICPGFDK